MHDNLDAEHLHGLSAGRPHPFGRPLSDLRIGDAIATENRRITLPDIEQFAELTGDRFYAHMDDAAAKANPFFQGRIAHGFLVLSFAAGLFVDPNAKAVLANYGVDNLRFLKPVYPGDTIRVLLKVKQISAREDRDFGEVRWDCTVLRNDRDVAARYDLLTLVAKTLGS
jgi:oxepin-CoA hydrolase/3-oxo-5,6-dehydrosuberyl-CoA semialdehyde dehydrogenase